MTNLNIPAPPSGQRPVDTYQWLGKILEVLGTTKGISWYDNNALNIKQLGDAIGNDINFSETVDRKIADSHLPVQIPAYCDLDTYTETGLYTSDSDGNTATITNRPPGTKGFILQVYTVLGSAESNRVIQIAYMCSDAMIYTRSKDESGTNWSEWVSYIKSTDVTPNNTGNKVVQRDSSGNFSAGTITASLSGNAKTATTLQTTRNINGTPFNGSGNITTANWGTSRNITIGNSTKPVNGSTNVTWTLSEIGAANASHTHSYLPLSGGSISSSSFGPLIIERTGSTNGAGIGFKNTNGVLGYIGMSASANGGLIRFSTDTNTRYTVLDTGNFKSHVTPSAIGAATTSHTHTSAQISDATNANTANMIVKRDGSGNFSAGTISASLNGTALYANYMTLNTRMDYGWNGVNYFNISGTAGNAAKVNDTPTTTWWHIMRFNHSNSTGFYTDLAVPFNDTSLYYKRVTSGTVQNGGWVKVLDSLNYTSFVPTKTGSGASGTWEISVSGNASTATTLQTARTINGTSFDGTSNITTANWGTARTITIGNTGKSVNGSANVSWSLSEIGAIGNSGDQTINVAEGVFNITGNNNKGHIDVTGAFHTREDSNDIWYERNVRPASWINATLDLGASGQRWRNIWASNGTIQTSDERYKDDIIDISDTLFFDMVKGVSVNTYVMRETPKDINAKNPPIELYTQKDAPSDRIHVGIIAQEMAKFECSKYILVKENEDDYYSVNNYNFISAVMAALKVEISRRESLEERVIEREKLIADLTDRLGKLENAIEKLLIEK